MKIMTLPSLGPHGKAKYGSGLDPKAEPKWSFHKHVLNFGTFSLLPINYEKN